MPLAHCKTCGGTTNSTTSDYWERFRDGKSEATECYAKFVNGKWVAGCALETADDYKVDFARQLIKEDAEKK